MDDDYEALAMRRLAKTFYDAYQGQSVAQSGEGNIKRMTMEPWKDCDEFARKMVFQNLPANLQDRLRAKLNIPPPGVAAPAQK